MLMLETMDAGRSFQKLYYDLIDNRRDKIDGLFKDEATAQWCGHVLKGIDAIKKFIGVCSTQETFFFNY